MQWVEQQIDNPRIFPPPQSSIPYPKDFRKRMSAIFRRLFRVYAHIYHHHYQQLEQLDLDKGLNTAFKHFVCFAKEFDLIGTDEMAAMDEWIGRLDRRSLDLIDAMAMDGEAHSRIQTPLTPQLPIGAGITGKSG
eukprot:TRINITY_DN1556_c1_g1_i2.p4 TRINITY_DN1556_c1_g1~~TRINITY_DN1556_c1_g1_i2.p4  ORF type:complete len:135 (-),score=26.71 TRINITY_DN1556_c1_g1_i2:689-1093(-)